MHKIRTYVQRLREMMQRDVQTAMIRLSDPLTPTHGPPLHPPVDPQPRRDVREPHPQEHGEEGLRRLRPFLGIRGYPPYRSEGPGQ